jgi:integrase
MYEPHPKPDPGQLRTRAEVLAVFDRYGLAPSALVLFARAWIETILNLSTAFMYSRAIGGWLAWCEGSDVDPGTARVLDARRYLTVLASRTANKSMAVYCAAARKFYRAAIESELAVGNPFVGVGPSNEKPKEETPALTEQEFDRVLDIIEANARASTRPLSIWRDFTVVYLAGRIGIRRIELIRLDGSAPRRDEAGWLLRVDGKGDDHGLMRLPADCGAVIEFWRGMLEQALGRPLTPSEPLLPQIGNRLAPPLDASGHLVHLAPGSVTRMVSKYLKAADLEGPRLAAHCLRSTAATIGYEHTRDLDRVQRLLRHARRETTIPYVKRWEAKHASVADEWRPRPRHATGTEPLAEQSLDDLEEPRPDDEVA